LNEAAQREIARRSRLGLRRVWERGREEQVVLTRTQTRILHEIVERGDTLNEAAALVIRAYSRIQALHGRVNTPEAKMAEIAAIMGVYNADRSVGGLLVGLLT